MSDGEGPPRKSARKSTGKKKRSRRPFNKRVDRRADVDSRTRDPMESVARLQEEAHVAAKKALILQLLEDESLTITGAAKRAEIARSTLYKWKDLDHEFARALNEAYDAGTDALEDECTKRAKEKSDFLLLETLRKRRAEWRRNAPPATVSAPSYSPDEAAFLAALRRLPSDLVSKIVDEMERIKAEDETQATRDRAPDVRAM